MRIAVIADVHGNLPALEAVAADMVARGISRVVNLGDHVSGPLWPRETADFLMHQPWTAIAGNHDRQLAFDDPAGHGRSDKYAYERLTPEHLRWLSALPASITLDDVSLDDASLDEAGMLLCHGIPGDDLEYLLETPEHGRLRLARAGEIRARLGRVTARVVACGHSHNPRLVHLSDGIAIVNPGSVGLQAYTVDGAQPHVSETGSPLARYAILEFTDALPRVTDPRVTFVAVKYDHVRVAQQAASNGRPDWALALRTGYAQNTSG
ncbi:MAG: metallophosphoesterase family protein [Planctomycetes bacterium]|nr:metallophosphoesterase family protein [Planctomycetota bacterium]